MSDSILDQVIQHPEVIYTLAQELVAEREQLEGIRKQLDRVFCVKKLQNRTLYHCKKEASTV